MTEEKWLATDEFFSNIAHDPPSHNLTITWRNSILLSAHAISRVTHLLSQPDDLQPAKDATAMAFELAEKTSDDQLVSQFRQEFVELRDRGLAYGRQIDRCENWELRFWASASGEVLLAIWQLGQIINQTHPESYLWRVLASCRQAIRNAGTTEETSGPANEARIAERGWHTKLCREIFGNPFRPPIIEPYWLISNDRTVAKLTQAIYDEKTFDRMPILADALEDAGCDNAEILDHCRGSGPHVRGCWVLDLLLNKS